MKEEDLKIGDYFRMTISKSEYTFCITSIQESKHSASRLVSGNFIRPDDGTFCQRSSMFYMNHIDIYNLRPPSQQEVDHLKQCVSRGTYRAYFTPEGTIIDNYQIF